MKAGIEGACFDAAGAQWEKARELFDLMQQQACTPDVVTYTALISAFERGGKWQLALQVLFFLLSTPCLVEY